MKIIKKFLTLFFFLFVYYLFIMKVESNNSDLLSISDSGPVEKLRGPSFAAEEDRDICKAWIKISEDPIKGKYKGSKYWSMVAAEFNLTEHQDQGPREATSLRSRWNIFAPRVVEYHDYFLTIERTNASLTGIFAKVNFDNM